MQIPARGNPVYRVLSAGGLLFIHNLKPRLTMNSIIDLPNPQVEAQMRQVRTSQFGDESHLNLDKEPSLVNHALEGVVLPYVQMVGVYF
jgi:hypothetical protein